MDIDSLPSNSHKSKEEKYHKPEKDLSPVVSQPATVKKKSGIVKLADVFLPEDVASVRSYIVSDVIIPKIKNVLHDIGAEAWDSFWGISGRSTSRGTASRVSYVSYDKYSKRAEHSDQPRQRSGIDYNDVEFRTRGEAELVLDRMGELCEEYGAVSVADFYSISDVTNENYTLNKWGWTDISGMKVVGLSGGGYSIKMPRAIPLD